MAYGRPAEVERHVTTFNAAVTSGEWGRFVDFFADDATLEFDAGLSAD